MEDTNQQYSSSYFCFCVCCCFFYHHFPFYKAFFYFIFYFLEAYPFKNNCQIEIFVTVYLSKEYLLNKQSLPLCEVSRTLRILKKNMLFRLNAVFAYLYSKKYYFEESFTLAIAFYHFHIYILFYLLLRANSTQRIIRS